MALTLRPTRLGSPIDSDREDYGVFSREWRIGRIYEIRGGPDHLRWFWALNGILGKPGGLRTDDRAATLEEAKAQLRESWDIWLKWAGLLEVE
jgi:hypothetical protein